MEETLVPQGGQRAEGGEEATERECCLLVLNLVSSTLGHDADA
jgi:hypothetical protein